MRILLVDDHTLFRQGLRLLLSDLSTTLDFTEAESCEAMPSTGEFDVVLLDYHLPGVDGLAGLAMTRSRFETASVVMLSGEDDPEIIRQIIDHGASGFVPKSSPAELLVAALKLILAGGVYLPPNALTSANPRPVKTVSTAAPAGLSSDNAGHPELEIISPRQREVLQLAVQGKVNKIIAREMDISESTVKAHLSAAYRALGVQNRTEAVFAVAQLQQQ